MLKQIPNEIPWAQLNKGDFTGSIWSSRNIDLKRNHGVLRVSEKNIVTTTSTSDTIDVSRPADDTTVTFSGSENAIISGYVVNPSGSAFPTVQNSWTVTGSNVSSLTQEITVPSGTNQSLFVVIDAIETAGVVSGDVQDVSDVTFNGVSLTNQGGNKGVRGDGFVTNSRVYTVGSPTQTTADVVVTLTGTEDHLVVHIILLEGTDTTTPYDSRSSEDTSGTSTSLTLDMPSGKTDHVRIISTVTTPSSHSYNDPSAETVIASSADIGGGATYSCSIFGKTETLTAYPQSLVTAFCKEIGTVSGLVGKKWWAMSDTGVYATNATNQTFSTDDSTTLPTLTSCNAEGDMVTFNDNIYLAVGTYLYKRDQTTWSTVKSDLPDGKKLLRVYADRLYIFCETEVWSIDTSDTFADPSTPDTYSLDLVSAQNEDLFVSCAEAVSNGFWIGTANKQGGRAKAFFWDGRSASTLETQKLLESGMAMAMAVKDDLPYILDNRGVLMAYNGSYFQEVARFDFDYVQLYRFDQTDAHNKWVHPNGMKTIDDEILMAISTRPEDTNDEIPIRHPAGVYAFHPEFGIYLKHTFTAHKDEASYTDHGHLEVAEVGAIFTLFDDEENDDRTKMSDFFVSYGYKSDNSTTVYAIAKNDKLGQDRTDTTKAGVIITPWISADQVLESWEKIYTFVKPLTDSNDKLVVKYRRQEYTPVTSDIAWVDTTSFTSTDSDWSTIKTNFEAGVEYEVEGLSGDGAGFCSHITNITEAGGTYTVTVDETITGATTNTAKVRVDRWEKLNTPFTDDGEVEHYKHFSADGVSSKAQFKIYMVGKEIELERLVIKSSVAQEF